MEASVTWPPAVYSIDRATSRGSRFVKSGFDIRLLVNVRRRGSYARGGRASMQRIVGQTFLPPCPQRYLETSVIGILPHHGKQKARGRCGDGVRKERDGGRSGHG